MLGGMTSAANARREGNRARLMERHQRDSGEASSCASPAGTSTAAGKPAALTSRTSSAGGTSPNARASSSEISRRRRSISPWYQRQGRSGQRPRVRYAASSPTGKRRSQGRPQRSRWPGGGRVNRRAGAVQREGELEGAAFARDAFRPGATTVHLHDLADDRKAQAGPLDVAAGAGLDAREALEHLLQRLRRDAHAVVLHLDVRDTVFSSAPQDDVAAFGRVFHGVVNEIRQRSE